MNKPTIHPVILCGGSGSRLWPLSRAGFPKQFLVLPGSDLNLSLFQQAVLRIQKLGNSQVSIGQTLVVTNEEHRFLALDQLRELKEIAATLLLEPVGRNTAPALTLAAFQANADYLNRKSDSILVVVPADQTIKNEPAFVKALNDCVELVADDLDKKTIVTLGITPSAPETGYGYIKRAQSKGNPCEFLVERFIEKPDLATAQTYLSSGNYLWNSGMFILYASTWISALQEFRPDILAASKLAWQEKLIDQSGDTVFIRPDKEFFKAIPNESIDYAVIEKCP